MIFGIGTDIVAVKRIEHVIDRNPAFITKVFTPVEIEYCEARASKAQSYAARFAAKEAAMKALGTGWGEGLSWQEFEILNNPAGNPSLVLKGKALERAEAAGIRSWHVSLSHEKEYALAFVVMESGRLMP
ncbi:MAG: holo-ACP synthase [Candidatus Cloacimonetes bacterium]|nr:holo-ACP synthase [Candidatus Cloacimonadota bacterium]